MWPMAVVVVRVLAENGGGVPLVDDQGAVEELGADGADEPWGRPWFCFRRSGAARWIGRGGRAGHPCGAAGVSPSATAGRPDRRGTRLARLRAAATSWPLLPAL